MRLLALVAVDVTHTTGPFASREDLQEKLRDDVITDPGQIDGTEGGEYAVDGFEVNAFDPEELIKGLRDIVKHAKHGVNHGIPAEVIRALGEKAAALIAKVPQ